MANDYWTGGWAQPNPNELPGTRAAKLSGSSYGPLNALGDILGAVMERNNMRGAMKALGEYTDEGGILDSVPTTKENPTAWVNDVAFTPEQAQQAQQLTGHNMLSGMVATPDNPKPLAGTVPETQPLSYQDYRKKMRGTGIKAAQKLFREYGAQGMQAVMPLLQAEIDDRVNNYGNTLLGQKRDAINNMVNGQVDLSDPRKLYQSIGDYNVLAQQMGVPMWDNSAYSEYAKMNMPNVQSVNLGGQIGYRGIYPDGRIANLGGDKVTMTPAQAASQIMAEKQFAANREDEAFRRRVQEAQLQLQQNRAYLEAQQIAARIEKDRKSGGVKLSELTSLYGKQKEVFEYCMEQAENATDEGMREYWQERANAAQKDLDIINTYVMSNFNSSDNPNYVGSGNVTVDQNAVSKWIEQRRREEATDEEIAEELKANGLNPNDWLGGE